MTLLHGQPRLHQSKALIARQSDHSTFDDAAESVSSSHNDFMPRRCRMDFGGSEKLDHFCRWIFQALYACVSAERQAVEN